MRTLGRAIDLDDPVKRDHLRVDQRVANRDTVDADAEAVVAEEGEEVPAQKEIKGSPPHAGPVVNGLPSLRLVHASRDRHSTPSLRGTGNRPGPGVQSSEVKQVRGLVVLTYGSA